MAERASIGKAEEGELAAIERKVCLKGSNIGEVANSNVQASGAVNGNITRIAEAKGNVSCTHPTVEVRAAGVACTTIWATTVNAGFVAVHHAVGAG